MKWDDEPNEWRGEFVHIMRHPTMKHLCGYVAVPPGHPYYGVGYGELYERGFNPAVHGGLTFADEEDGLWWFGFDCGHAGDLIPAMRVFPDDVYRDFEYVKAQCLELMRQLVEARKS